MTVEAALIVPMFLMAMILIAYLINVYYVHRCIGMELENICRQISAYAYPLSLGKESAGDIGTAGEIASVFYVRDHLNSAIAENPVAASMVKQSVRCEKSEILEKDGNIDLIAEYTVEFPGAFFGIGKMNFVQQVRMHGWVGYSENPGQEENEEFFVYVTEEGVVYHCDSNCSYLNPSVRMVPGEVIQNLRSSDGSKYYPCEVCGADASEACYITDYGYRYHSRRDCSGIKRTVQRIPISEAGSLRPCSKCGGNH